MNQFTCIPRLGSHNREGASDGFAPLQGCHRKTGHVLGVHVGDGRGATADPDRLTFKNRNSELTDHPLHEGGALKNRVIKIGGLQQILSAGLDVHQGNIPVTVCSQQGEKNEAFDTRTFTGSDQIQLSVPVGDVHALGICRATGCRIDDGIDTVKGVIQAGWLKQITAGELTTPLLKKRRFARRSNHATHLMSGVEGLAGDLAPQGARTTHHQNLHGVS